MLAQPVSFFKPTQGENLLFPRLTALLFGLTLRTIRSFSS